MDPAWPTHQDLAVDPELALLTVLDAAVRMTVELLAVFHPPDDDPEAYRCRSHRVAFQLRRDARHLQHTLLEYRDALDFDCGREPPPDDGPCEGDDEIPW